jgi:hypothetical protein
VSTAVHIYTVIVVFLILCSAWIVVRLRLVMVSAVVALSLTPWLLEFNLLAGNVTH